MLLWWVALGLPGCGSGGQHPALQAAEAGCLTAAPHTQPTPAGGICRGWQVLTAPAPAPPGTLPPARSDASPIRVELRDTRPGVLRLLVRVCAVVGGAFAVTGLLDKIIEGLLRDVRKALRHSQ